jgi:hypothetical protein
VTGQGYRFIAPIIGPEQENRADIPSRQPATAPERSRRRQMRKVSADL